jgi:hypothetical protein
MVPASLTARGTGASFSKDNLVVIFHVRQQCMTEAPLSEHNNVVCLVEQCS